MSKNEVKSNIKDDVKENYIQFGNMKYIPRIIRCLKAIFHKVYIYHYENENLFDMSAGFEGDSPNIRINSYLKFQILELYENDEENDTYEISLIYNYKGVETTLKEVSDIHIIKDKEKVNKKSFEKVSKIFIDFIKEFEIKDRKFCFCRQIAIKGENYCEDCIYMCCELDDKDLVCPICLDEKLKLAHWVKTDCNHYFHKHCYYQIKGENDTDKQYKRKCPLCRHISNSNLI